MTPYFDLLIIAMLNERQCVDSVTEGIKPLNTETKYQQPSVTRSVVSYQLASYEDKCRPSE